MYFSVDQFRNKRNLDGATKFQIFRKITLPLSKPIIVYTVLTSFMAPWMDFIFASVIMGDNYDNYTVALGLFKMLEREFINDYYTQFAAGCVLISIPIAALFIMPVFLTYTMIGSTVWNIILVSLGAILGASWEVVLVSARRKSMRTENLRISLRHGSVPIIISGVRCVLTA